MAFSLLARLWTKDQKTDAFRVLKTCEAIEYVPSVTALIAGLVAVFCPGRPLWSIPVAIVTGKVLGLLLINWGFFIVLNPSGIMLGALVWSYIPLHPSAVIHVPLLVFFFIRFGWFVSAIWVAGNIAAFMIYWTIEFRISKWRCWRVGVPFTLSEISFFNAYRLHADRLGVPHNVDVTEEEVSSGHWKACFADYALNYPAAVQRFAGSNWLTYLEQQDAESPPKEIVVD